jgi:hypothetical protein
MKSETAASRASSLPDEDLSIQPPASPSQRSNVGSQFHADQSYVQNSLSGWPSSIEQICEFCHNSSKHQVQPYQKPSSGKTSFKFQMNPNPRSHWIVSDHWFSAEGDGLKHPMRNSQSVLTGSTSGSRAPMGFARNLPMVTSREFVGMISLGGTAV